MFEKAARLKLRFDTTRGLATVEDLWDLPLTSRTNAPNLDDIARALSKQVKETATESFVIKAPAKDEAVELRFEIVKHIIGVRLAETEVRAAKAKAREQKDRILEVIAKKDDEALVGKSRDELLAMVEAL